MWPLKREIKQAREIAFERTQILWIKNSKVAFVNMFKELKENILKEVKDDLMTMSQQTENSNKENLFFKKKQKDILTGRIQ